MNSWTQKNSGAKPYLLKEYKDPLDSLSETEEKENRLHFVSANVETTNIFVEISEQSSRYLKPKVKKKI